jgi:hypothetical protein
MKAVLGTEYKDPREYKGIIGKNSGGKFVSKKTLTQQGVPKNVHSLGYLLYAYNFSKTTFFAGARHLPPSSLQRCKAKVAIKA